MTRTRKIIACVLLALQLVTACCLIWKARADERAEKKRVAALLSDGAVYALPFSYMHGGMSEEDPDGNVVYWVWFGPDLPDGNYGSFDTLRFAVSPSGELRALWPDEEAEGETLTLDYEPLNQAVYRDRYVSAAVFERLSQWGVAEDGWLELTDLKNGVFRKGGETHTVFVRARVLGADVLFDGLLLDGDFFPFIDLSSGR